ncbi:MAG: hypothetical protein ACI9IP_000831 [Arcticibacterium sp.]|jgi:hypothetical protein
MTRAYLLIFLFLSSCVDKYDFNVKKDNRGLVIEASISNISFTETLLYPSDGRYFKVKLTETNDVDNIRDEPISDASVKLKDSSGSEYTYIANWEESGTYYLEEDFFKAEVGNEYQLEIILNDGQVFKSNWERLPEGGNQMGAIDYMEAVLEDYVHEAGEKVIRSINGMQVNIEIPDESFNENQFYRWTFDPFWTYTSVLLPDDSPVKYCYATSNEYLGDFVLSKIRKGGFDQNLFFVRTKGNWRLYDYFSVLVHQEKLSSGFYQFWVDLEAQKDKGGLYDQPPFGLATNYSNVNGSWTVNGYFGVVDETTTRWTFSPQKLRYSIENNLERFCIENGDPDPRIQPPGQCYDCRSHSLGKAVNYPPIWWENLEKLN